MKVYNWGIIGPGKIAGRFASDLQYADRGSLYAVASRSEKNARAFAESFQIQKAFSDYKAMLRDPEVDIIYVATPHAFHKQITIDCLRAGKAVLCEKPMSLSAAEVKEMISIARNNKTFLMEAMWTAFLPHYRYVHSLLADDTYGKISLLESDFGFRADYNPESRLWDKTLGGGSLLDIGIYPAFCAMDLLGMPTSIKATAVFAPTGADTQTHSIFGYEDCIAVLRSTFADSTPTETIIYTQNSKIKLCGRWHEPTTVEVIKGEKKSVKSFDVKGKGYQYEAIEVMKCLDEGQIESQIMPFDMSLKLAALLDEIRKEIGLIYS